MSTFITRDLEGKQSYARARLQRDALNLIRDALETSGMTQVDLAKALGVRKGAVNQVLRGNGNLRLSTLADYMAVLDVQPRIISSLLDFGQAPDYQSEKTTDPFENFESGTVTASQVGSETVVDQHSTVAVVTESGVSEVKVVARLIMHDSDLVGPHGGLEHELATERPVTSVNGNVYEPNY